MKNLKLLFGCLVLTILQIFHMGKTITFNVSDAGALMFHWQVLRYNLDGFQSVVLGDNEFFAPAMELVGHKTSLPLKAKTPYWSHAWSEIGLPNTIPLTGAYIEDFATVSGGPTRMKYGPDGKIYVLQWSNTINKVLRFEGR